jgi:hypothetical protein
MLRFRQGLLHLKECNSIPLITKGEMQPEQSVALVQALQFGTPHGWQRIASKKNPGKQEVHEVGKPMQFWQGGVQESHTDPLSQVPGRQDVQVVPEVEQFWHGEVQGSHIDPLSQVPFMQERHVVPDVEQLTQGAVHGEHVVPSSHIPFPQEVHVVADPAQVRQGVLHSAQFDPILRNDPTVQEVHVVAVVMQVAQGVSQSSQVNIGVGVRYLPCGQFRHIHDEARQPAHVPVQGKQYCPSQNWFRGQRRTQAPKLSV